MATRSATVPRDAAYVQDIVDSCRAIASYTSGMSLAAFIRNAMAQDAIARRLFVVGEAAKILSDDFRRTVPDIDWKNIARLRDKLGHHYWSIEVDKIWDIVEVHIPALRKALEAHPILKG